MRTGVKSLNDKEYTVLIPGRPITKKNSGRYFGKGKFLPSEAYAGYERVAIPALKSWARAIGLSRPIDYPVEVTAVYIMPNRAGWPDLVGLMQATADLLEAAGIVEDDRLIVSWGTSHIHGVDKEKAGVTIKLRAWNKNELFDPWNLDPWLIKRRDIHE